MTDRILLLIARILFKGFYCLIGNQSTEMAYNRHNPRFVDMPIMLLTDLEFLQGRLDEREKNATKT